MRLFTCTFPWIRSIFQHQKKKKKKRSHLTLCSAEGVWPSSCYCPQEPFAWSPAGAEVGEFTPMSTASLPRHPMQPFVSECTLGPLLGQLLYKKQLFGRLKSEFQVAFSCVLVWGRPHCHTSGLVTSFLSPLLRGRWLTC